ncbi:MAG: hypothetical protein ACFE0I_06915 [Elainellaceae cyanobacterium]
MDTIDAKSDFNGIVGFPYVNHNLQVLVISGDVPGNQVLNCRNI